MPLLDVRSAEEYAGDGHVAGSTLIPLPELERRVRELPTDRPIVCICRSGNRSTTACDSPRARASHSCACRGGMIALGARRLPDRALIAQLLLWRGSGGASRPQSSEWRCGAKPAPQLKRYMIK